MKSNLMIMLGDLMSLITELKIPPINQYAELKKYILSNQHPWYRESYSCGINLNESPDVWDDGVDISHFSYCYTSRPRTRMRAPSKIDAIPTRIYSTIMDVVEQILEYNGIHVGCIFRLNVNMLLTHPEDNSWGAIHVDHKFPHKNLLIYLTPKCTTGGDLRVYEDTHDGTLNRPAFEKYETFTPTEDSAVTFDGDCFHSGQTPTTEGERRILIVVTYCTELRYTG